MISDAADIPFVEGKKILWNIIVTYIDHFGTRLFKMPTTHQRIRTERVREETKRHNVGNSSSGKRFHMCGGGSRRKWLWGVVIVREQQHRVIHHVHCSPVPLYIKSALSRSHFLCFIVLFWACSCGRIFTQPNSGGTDLHKQLLLGYIKWAHWVKKKC